MSPSTNMRRRLRLAATALASASVLFIGSTEQRAVGVVGGGVREGGTFRVNMGAGAFDSIDPALAYQTAAWLVLQPVCERLMSYPDKPPPAGFRLIPELAREYPRASRDLKTWTFTLRGGYRFSDGTAVEASAFARAINRTLALGARSFGAEYMKDIVGAEAVRSKRTETASGVTASGNTLVVRFKRPVPDFPHWTTMPFLCAVPPNLQADPEGVGAFPSAGPYYVADYRSGTRIVIQRNRFYGGTRPHHVERFDVDLRPSKPGQMLDEIERGETDWGFTSREAYFDPGQRLVAKYGVNREQFFVKPGLAIWSYTFNTSRPLFRNNPRLRRAISFAIDRSALARGRVGRPTDQYLPPDMPGFKDASIYPLRGPAIQRALGLARGNTRSGKAVLYTLDTPGFVKAARIIRANLAKIGLDVQIKQFPPGSFFTRAADRAERFDIVMRPWNPDYVDPFQLLNILFERRFIGTTNWARFHSPEYNRLLRRAAGLGGQARVRAYEALDARLARDAVPAAPVAFFNQPTLVSKRVGCVVLRPWGEFNLTAACLE